MPYIWTEERMNYWRKTMKLYGLTPQGVNAVRKELLIAQLFKCGVCRGDLRGKTAFLDHDHHTGGLRGVLCYACNRFRVAKNSADTAVEVVRYLNDPPAPKLLPPILLRLGEPEREDTSACID